MQWLFSILMLGFLVLPGVSWSQSSSDLEIEQLFNEIFKSDSDSKKRSRAKNSSESTDASDATTSGDTSDGSVESKNSSSPPSSDMTLDDASGTSSGTSSDSSAHRNDIITASPETTLSNDVPLYEESAVDLFSDPGTNDAYIETPDVLPDVPLDPEVIVEDSEGDAEEEADAGVEAQAEDEEPSDDDIADLDLIVGPETSANESTEDAASLETAGTDTAVNTDTAQDNPLTADPNTFTGTYSEEDEDNSELAREAALFGSNEVEPEDEEAPPDGRYYAVKFDFNTALLFSDNLTGDIYMEVTYKTNFEIEMQIDDDKRSRADGFAEYTTDVTGSLARNELFDCQLDIEMKKSPVDIMAKIRREITEGEAAETTLAMQLKFEKTANEAWLSKCLSSDQASSLNTRGEKESYNLQALEAITPALSGLMMPEGYNPLASSTMGLAIDPFEIDDIDTNDNVLVTGSGSLSVEPIEAPSEDENEVTIVEDESADKDKKSSRRNRRKRSRDSDEDDTITEEVPEASEKTEDSPTENSDPGTTEE